MKIPNLKVWQIVICLLITMILISSCGARKAESAKIKESVKAEFSDKSKSEQSEQSQNQSEINIKKTEVVSVDDQNQTISKKEIIEPIDPTRPASYIDENGKKQELNNSKKTTETTTQKNNTKTKAEAKTEASGKAESQTNKKGSKNKDIKAKSDSEKLAKVKVIDREDWSAWNLLWLLIPVALLYFVWRNRVSIVKKITGVWWV